MKRLIILAILAAFSAKAEDGVFVRDSAADVQLKVEEQDVVMRIPMAKSTPPQVRCILLANSKEDSEVIHTPEGFSPLGFYVAPPKSAPQQGYVIIVILYRPPAQEQARVVVLKGKVFWDVEVTRSPHDSKAGWLELPVNAAKGYTQYLQAAGQLFGVEKDRLFDLRPTDEQRAKPASVKGPLSKEDVAEIKRTVFAMARHQILEELSSCSPERWAEVVREWPGRNVLKISSSNGRQAGVYYAPNAGCQMEKVRGKWLVVGG